MNRIRLLPTAQRKITGAVPWHGRDRGGLGQPARAERPARAGPELRRGAGAVRTARQGAGASSGREARVLQAGVAGAA